MLQLTWIWSFVLICFCWVLRFCCCFSCCFSLSGCWVLDSCTTTFCVFVLFQLRTFGLTVRLLFDREVRVATNKKKFGSFWAISFLPQFAQHCFLLTCSTFTIFVASNGRDKTLTTSQAHRTSEMESITMLNEEKTCFFCSLVRLLFCLLCVPLRSFYLLLIAFHYCLLASGYIRMRFRFSLLYQTALNWIKT